MVEGWTDGLIRVRKQFIGWLIVVMGAYGPKQRTVGFSLKDTIQAVGEDGPHTHALDICYRKPAGKWRNKWPWKQPSEREGAFDIWVHNS